MPGPPIPEAELRSLVRQRIGAKAIPVALVTQVWGGYGRDEPCCVCGEVIQHSQIEYEARVPDDGKFAFHMKCYALWQLECGERVGSVAG